MVVAIRFLMFTVRLKVFAVRLHHLVAFDCVRHLRRYMAVIIGSYRKMLFDQPLRTPKLEVP